MPVPAAKHQRLERKHKRLKAQDQCMNKRKRVDGVKSQAADRTGVLGRDDVVVIGIGVRNTTAPRRYAL
jgi:hypothetical protein